MSNKTKYDIWCLDNQIGNGDLFLDNLKSASKVDSRFLELYNELLTMNNEYAEIEPGITDFEIFENRLITLYNYGSNILKEHILLMMFFDEDLNKSNEAISIAFREYSNNYNHFLNKLNSWYNKETQDKIIDKVNRFKINKAKEEASKKVYNIPTQDELKDMLGYLYEGV